MLEKIERQFNAADEFEQKVLNSFLKQAKINHDTDIANALTNTLFKYYDQPR